MNSKWVVKLLRRLAISTMPLVQESLTNAQYNGNFDNSVMEMRVLKMKSQMNDVRLLTMTT